MISVRRKKIVAGAIAGIVLSVFVVDTGTPLGVADWVLYFIPLMMSVYVGGRYFPFQLAAIVSGLILVGFYFAPRGLEPHLALMGRVAGIGGLWFMAAFLCQLKRAWVGLRFNEERFRSALQHSGIGMAIVAPDGRWLEVNPALCAIVGYSREELLATDFQSLTHPDDLEADLAFVRRILSREIETYQMEKRYFHKDGHVIWIQLNVSLVRDAAGEPLYFVSQIQDITKRKAADEEIAHLASFPRLNPIPIVEVDQSGRIGFMNRAALKKFPDLKEEGLRHPFLAGLEAVYAKIQAAPDDSLLRELTVDECSCQQVLHAVAETQSVRIYAFDITDRKRAEEQIREQTRLLDLAHDAIVVRDMDDRIRYWNKGAEQLFGWSAKEALEKPAGELLQEEHFRHQEALKRVLDKGRWSGEFNYRSKAGCELTVETRLTLVRDPEGNPKSILSISTDITDKKRYEAQSIRSQRMESLGTLASGIAHDLNNVLSPLLVSVQVLKEKVTDEDGKKLLAALENNVQRGAHLVKQVLAFGRGVTGGRILVQPKHIIREIKQVVHETFPKSIEFEFHPAADSWTVIGDPTQLHQAVLNLCLNARDAMPSGGKLSISLENVEFDEVYAGMNQEVQPGPYVFLKVSDTGKGIPREIQEKIFDPLFTTKEPGAGFGMSLATTLAIVKSHGGFIDCYSEPGQGTTFKVYLPAHTAMATAEKLANGNAGLPRGHNELVLVVDDEEPICLVAKKMLERFGYRVLLASDGIEAVSLYATRRNEIDVVITDMAMPNMDGFATIGALKAINAGVKIVGSSGFASGTSVNRINSSGVRYFVAKPYTAETMLGTLHEILQEGQTS